MGEVGQVWESGEVHSLKPDFIVANLHNCWPPITIKALSPRFFQRFFRRDISADFGRRLFQRLGQIQ